MTPAFREASRDDVEAIAALLSDDVLGKRREARDLDRYRAAFDAMASEPNNPLIVGEAEGRIVAVYQITFISGLSRGGARRAQIEAVRVAADARGRGLGEALMRDAEARARAEGCARVPLTTDRARVRAHRFYDRLGYVASHFGYKRALDS
ncbi:MAG: GNAT family N-acetyltransferase [Pseudomonadota bacterium]